MSFVQTWLTNLWNSQFRRFEIQKFTVSNVWNSQFRRFETRSFEGLKLAISTIWNSRFPKTKLTVSEVWNSPRAVFQSGATWIEECDLQPTTAFHWRIEMNLTKQLLIKLVYHPLKSHHHTTVPLFDLFWLSFTSLSLMMNASPIVDGGSNGWQ